MGNTWEPKLDFGGAGRQLANAFSIGTKGYIALGGKAGFGSYDFFKDIWEYNPSDNTWTQKQDFIGLQRGMAGAFSLNNIGYIACGYTVYFAIYYHKDFFKYDPSTNTWTQLTGLPVAQGRARPKAFSIGSKGYVGGGTVITMGIEQTDFFEYDPSNDTWTQKTNIPRQISSRTAFSSTTHGYVVDMQSSRETYEYNPLNNSWTQKEDFIGVARRSSGFFQNYGFGYVGLGYQHIWPYYPSLNDFYEFRPLDNKWNQIANLSSLKRGVGFGIGDYGYFGTGSDVKTFYRWCCSNRVRLKGNTYTAGSAALPNVLITLVGTSTYSITSDSVGYYYIIVDIDLYAVTASLLFYEDKVESINLIADAEQDFYLNTLPDIYWTLDLGADISGSPIIDIDGIIYLSTYQYSGNVGYLYAINPDSTERWKYLLKNRVSWGAHPYVDSNNIIYAGDYGGWVYAINPDGTLKWETQIATRYVTCPAIVTNDNVLVLVISYNGFMYALDYADGSIVWSYSLPNPPWNLTPVISINERIYFGDDDGYIYCLDYNGNLIWKYDNLGVYINNSCAIDNSNILYVATDNGVLAINSDGTLKWSYIPSPADCFWGTGLLLHKSVLFIASYDLGKVYAINSSDGTLKWEYQLLDWSDSMINIDTLERLHVVDADGYYYLLDANTSALLYSYRFGHYFDVVYPAIAQDGTVYLPAYVNTRYGVLIALRFASLELAGPKYMRNSYFYKNNHLSQGIIPNQIIDPVTTAPHDKAIRLKERYLLE